MFFAIANRVLLLVSMIGMDTQAFKRSLHHSDRYNRRGFESPTKRAQALEKAYQSDLIASIRDNGYFFRHGRLRVRLAEAFGFLLGR